jgi:hypothetical protein
MRIGTRLYLQAWLERMQARDSVRVSAPEIMPAFV